MIRLVLVALTVSFVAGCDAETADVPMTVAQTPVTSTNVAPLEDVVVTASSTPLTSEPAATDAAAVLGAAARDRVLGNNSFGGTDVATAVIVVDRLGLLDDESLMIDTCAQEAAVVSDVERQIIEAALKPKPVTWMSSDEAEAFMSQRMEGGTGEDLTFVVTLAMPKIDGDRARVASQMWCSGLCGAGGEQVVERQVDGSWAVTGTAGTQWIS